MRELLARHQVKRRPDMREIRSKQKRNWQELVPNSCQRYPYTQERREYETGKIDAIPNALSDWSHHRLSDGRRIWARFSRSNDPDEAEPSQ